MKVGCWCRLQDPCRLQLVFVQPADRGRNHTEADDCGSAQDSCPCPGSECSLRLPWQVRACPANHVYLLLAHCMLSAESWAGANVSIRRRVTFQSDEIFEIKLALADSKAGHDKQESQTPCLFSSGPLEPSLSSLLSLIQPGMIRTGLFQIKPELIFSLHCIGMRQFPSSECKIPGYSPKQENPRAVLHTKCFEISTSRQHGIAIEARPQPSAWQ